MLKENNMQFILRNEGRTVSFKKGTRIDFQDSLAHHAAYIATGHVQLTQETSGGKELTTRVCGKSSVIGDVALYNQIAIAPLVATALTTVTLHVLPKAQLEQQMAHNPDALITYMQWLQVENAKQQSLLRDLLLHGKKGALFSTLIRLSHTYGNVLTNGDIAIKIALTNGELATLCGTSREMINRMLNDLKQQNIISFTKGFITIHEIRFLKDAIDCEDCPTSVCRID